MKVAIIVLAILAGVFSRHVEEYQHHQHTTNQKQQDVYDVLKYINNPIYHKEHAQIAQSYSLEANAHHYSHDAVSHFKKIHHDQHLKKGEIFSIFNDEHVHQAKALFKLFYHADTYQTFHQTALWARHHLNEGLFLYTYSVAIVHRDDTQDVVLPPIYEVYPHYFFNTEVIQEAYKYKMAHKTGGHHEYTIYSNYSGHYLNLDPEQSLSYYHEDVGINAFYFYTNLYYPYWMNSEEFKHVSHDTRGEVFHYLHKQLYARYHLERISHGVGEVEFFDWDVPFKTGYYPSLTYTNGLAFPERPHFANFKEYIHHYGERRCDKHSYSLAYTYVKIYEQRIREAIDSGFVIDHQGNKHQIYTPEGMNILANIIEGNADSPNHRYYGSYINMARHVLGYSKEPLDHHKLAPSALEHFSTTLRDPAFYQIWKKVQILINHYKENLPAYHYEHLYHQGLKVEHVEVEPMVTFYDHFHSDITNGLYVTPEEYESDSFKVKVHQYRLNHKNFNYKVKVNSEKETTVVVKVFIGPKYDEHGRPLHLSEVHDKVFEIDHSVHHLKTGENVIERNSRQFHGCSHEQSHEHVEHVNHHGFPLRYKLPRGSEDGTTFQLYVIVYPYASNEHHKQYQNVQEVHGQNHPLACIAQPDNYPLGYPFDRPVEHHDVYHVPNAYVKHVKIYHQVNRNMQHHEHEDYDQEEVHHYYNQHGDHQTHRNVRQWGYEDQEQQTSKHGYHHEVPHYYESQNEEYHPKVNHVGVYYKKNVWGVYGPHQSQVDDWKYQQYPYGKHHQVPEYTEYHEGYNQEGTVSHGYGVKYQKQNWDQDTDYETVHHHKSYKPVHHYSEQD